MRLWLLIAICSIAANIVRAQDANHFLEQFDKHPSATVANQFFQLLNSEELTDSLISFKDTTPRDTLRQQVWYWAAEYYYDLQEYNRAATYGLKALPLCQAGNNRAVEGDCLSILSLIYFRQGYFEKAAKYAKLCNQLDMKVGNPDNISSSLNTLAGIYMSLRQPKEAEKYILKAISYCQQVDNPQRMAVLLGMASETYHHLGKHETSLDYATKAYNLEQQLRRPDKIAIRQTQRAAALIALQRNKEAMAALNEAIPGLRKAGNLHSLGIACNQMGRLQHLEGNDTEAVRYYYEALDIFTRQHDLFNESHSRQGLYEALRASNPDLAMQHNDRYNELRDSLYDQETGELFSKYAAEYDNDTLRKENEGHRWRLRLYLILFIAALVLVAILWLSYRRRQQRRIRELMDQLTKNEESESEVRGYEGAEVRGYENQRSAPTGKANSHEAQDGNLAPSSPRTPTPTKEAPDTNNPISAEDRAFLIRVIEVVNTNLATCQFDIDYVAEEMGMSRSTFRRRMLAASGSTPKAYITAIQMRRASNLLKRHPDMLITEVSAQCGFEDTSSFNRAFKRAFGVSPSQFRGNA